MVDNDIITKHIPRETKNVVLTKKFKKSVYSLATRTTAQMVYMTDSYEYTVYEMISDIIKAIATSSARITGVSERLDAVLKDAPEEMNTFLEIWDYINIEGNSELAEALRNMYTKTEVDSMIEAIHKKIDETPNALIIEHGEEVDTVRSGDIFYMMEDNEIDGIDDPVYTQP